jgi:hypothetical protein
MSNDTSSLDKLCKGIRKNDPMPVLSSHAVTGRFAIKSTLRKRNRHIAGLDVSVNDSKIDI